MIESIITEKGVTLIGEAAQAYVRYKYFEAIWTPFAMFFAMSGIFGFLFWLGYRLIKKIDGR